MMMSEKKSRNQQSPLNEPGTFWENVLKRTATALAHGDLQPLPTHCEYLAHEGIEFMVHVLDSLARKSEEKKIRARLSTAETKQRDPFLPYEEALFVGHILPSHIALLNKYNVVNNHTLIVTQAFEEQTDLLNQTDFLAIWLCLSDHEGLGFYNGGVLAGASQSHKHMQYVPIPLDPWRSQPVPFQKLFSAAASGAGNDRVPGFPFLHRFVYHGFEKSGDVQHVSQGLLLLYQRMLLECGMARHDLETGRQLFPYNLLLTREWMLVVPRRAELFQTISLNSLAFVGSLFVMNEQERDLLRRHGPLTALQSVTFPSR